MQNIRLLLVIVAEKTATEILLRTEEQTNGRADSGKTVYPLFFEAGV
jgi:hypothetical protein